MTQPPDYFERMAAEAEAEVEQELTWDVYAAMQKRGAATYEELYQMLVVADDPEAAAELAALTALDTYIEN